MNMVRFFREVATLLASTQSWIFRTMIGPYIWADTGSRTDFRQLPLIRTNFQTPRSASSASLLQP